MAAIAPIVDISIWLIIVLEDNKSIKGYNVNIICESINEHFIISLPIVVTLDYSTLQNIKREFDIK